MSEMPAFNTMSMMMLERVYYEGVIPVDSLLGTSDVMTEAAFAVEAQRLMIRGIFQMRFIATPPMGVFLPEEVVTVGFSVPLKYYVLTRASAAFFHQIKREHHSRHRKLQEGYVIYMAAKYDSLSK